MPSHSTHEATGRANSAQSPSNEHPRLEHRRIRVSRRPGTTLQIPPMSDAPALWQRNLQRREAADSVTMPLPGGESLKLHSFQSETRRELVQRAVDYARAYLPIDALDELESLGLDSEAVIMSGHQPELYHAGVWYKNFALSALGRRLGATTINLVVDSDLCESASVRYPRAEQKSDETRFRLATIPIDRAGPRVPWEHRAIVDQEFFVAFSDRVRAALTSPMRIAQPLWEHAVAAQNLFREQNLTEQHLLGAVTAAGRHRLEMDSGLSTLEIPTSWLARTEGFCRFAGIIISEIERFRRTYNDVLAEYRDVHRIRSRSHPVPPLARDATWFETPFWTWDKQNPARRPLWVQPGTNEFLLSDRNSWEHKVPAADLVSWIRVPGETGIAVRPRALTNTLFCRLLASDLFLHGVGGAKYDQLTDAIAEDFFGYQLPDFMVLSATMHLESDCPIVDQSDITAIEVRRRQYHYHPEQFLDQSEPKIRDWVEQKFDWINRSEPTAERHQAITQLNQQLRQQIPETDQQLDAEREQRKRQQRDSEIARSREYSFCLFPETLISELESRCRIT